MVKLGLIEHRDGYRVGQLSLLPYLIQLTQNIDHLRWRRVSPKRYEKST